MLDLSEKAHSPIGASSMHRWAECPGSIRLSKGIEKTSSVYAEEGTKAHAVAEYYLKNQSWPLQVDDEMKEAVQVYLNTIDGDRIVYEGEGEIEHVFDLSSVYPGLFGTADFTLWQPEVKLLRVYDYKHGAGIAVEPGNNPQLMYYGLGALLSLGYTAKEVELVIVQPRCYHPDGPVRRWRIPSVDLVDFAADLADYAKATEDPNAPLKAGDHCRFCPAAAICPEIKNKAQNKAKVEFAPALSYDPKTLAETLDWLPIFEAWIKNVREFAYGEAMHGRKVPGHKLVEKVARRKWADEALVYGALKTILPRDQVFEESLRSPAQIEKLLPKDQKGVLEPLVIKESSGLTLVPDSDKRIEVNNDAKSEFTSV